MKKCANCLYLGFNDEYQEYGYRKEYQCKLHKVKVDYPQDQFCGDENWISIKAKERLEKLEQLGI